MVTVSENDPKGMEGQGRAANFTGSLLLLLLLYHCSVYYHMH